MLVITNFALCLPYPNTDFDDIEVPSPVTALETSSGSGFHVNAEDGLVTLSEQHFAELQRTIQRLASQVMNIIG
jgi:hypothetical protein